MQPVSPIQSDRSPREILAADFESVHGELPIRGGWGYSQDDACIIDKNDPSVDQSVPFDGIDVEYLFVEMRICEEMIILRPDGEEFYDVEWKLLRQSLIRGDENVFDKMEFEITAFTGSDWEELMEELNGPQGCDDTEFDYEAYEMKRQKKMIRFTREFWFDISSFYGG